MFSIFIFFYLRWIYINYVNSFFCYHYFKSYNSIFFHNDSYYLSLNKLYRTMSILFLVLLLIIYHNLKLELFIALTFSSHFITCTHIILILILIIIIFTTFIVLQWVFLLLCFKSKTIIIPIIFLSNLDFYIFNIIPKFSWRCCDPYQMLH